MSKSRGRAVADFETRRRRSASIMFALHICSPIIFYRRRFISHRLTGIGAGGIRLDGIRRRSLLCLLIADSDCRAFDRAISVGKPPTRRSKQALLLSAHCARAPTISDAGGRYHAPIASQSGVILIISATLASPPAQLDRPVLHVCEAFSEVSTERARP